MASSALNTQISNNTRSNSLPCIQTTTSNFKFDEHLSRLKASQATSTSSSSSICHEINGLRDLHGCVDKLLQLPIVDEVLDRSLRLVNMCSTTKDALLHIKADKQEVQSVLRRRQGDKSTPCHEVAEYLSSRQIR
ncbi:hypothetical protein JRO89_XS02G0008400 [Xanthoceras sorbifolium]|uniref:Uncharacterized protein n=1 Tax=Xanthoceras sorbifolium TaxID=99658 RepID=A0ABQ8IDT1_9ROSI|nr:hypothetical protein JRO89_XS02G0008400 [Xanthoceras sorbifolium]